MYNLPYISYGIFAFVVVAVALLAWRKGFKAALYSFAMTLAATGIIVGIVYATFESIAPLFTNYIKNHFGGSASYDFSYISLEARPQIVAVCIAIGLIPVMGILFGVTYPIYRFVKKKDMPALLKKVSANSKKIKPRNAKVNRAGSIVASSLAAVSTGAIVATASSAALTTSSSFNIFNKISSYISQGASFGFGYDNLSMHRMYDFVPLTNDAKLMETFTRLLLTKSQDDLNDLNVQQRYNQDFKDLMSSENLHKLVEILNNTDTEVILKVLNSNFKHIEEASNLQLTSKNVTVQQRVYAWRPLGNEDFVIKNPDQTDQKTSATLQNLKTILDASDIHLGLNDRAINAIVSWLKSDGIQSFEKTAAFTKWHEQESAVAQLKMEQQKLFAELATRHQKLKDFKNTENNLRNGLLQFINSTNKDISRFNEINRMNGLLDVKKDEVRDAENTMKSAENEKDNAYNIKTNWQTNETDPKLSAMNSAKSTLDQKTQNLNNLNSEINTLNQQINDANDAIKRNNDIIARSQNTISSIDTENADLNKRLSTLNTDLQNLQNIKQTASNNLSTAQNNFNLSQAAVPGAESSLNSAVFARDTKRTEINQIQSQLSAAQSANPVDQSLVTRLQNDLATAISAIASLETAVTNAQNSLNSINAQFQAAKQKLSESQTAFDNATKNVADKNNAISLINNQISQNINNKNQAQSDMDAANRALNTEKANLANYTSQRDYKNNHDRPIIEAERNTADAEYTSKLGAYNAAKSEQDRLDGIYNDKNNIYISKKDIYDTKSREQSSLESELTNLNNSITSFENSLRDKQKNVIDASADVHAMDWTSDNFSVTYLSANNNVLADLKNRKPEHQEFFLITNYSETVNKSLANDYSSLEFVNSIQQIDNPLGTALGTDVEEIRDPVTGVVKDKIETKKASDVKFGTEGELQVIAFNIREGEKSQSLLNQIKQDRQTSFNIEVDKYIDLIKQHLK